MTIITPEIFYINLKTYFKVLKIQFSMKPTFMRIFITSVFLIIHFFSVLTAVMLRMLDYVLFPGFYKQPLNPPVFIIANPRSGTTYMHRLLCLDEDRFSYMLLWHTTAYSITMIKLVQFLGAIDSKIGKPMRSFFDFLDDKIFAGWKDIHPMGFNQAEEDEAVFVAALESCSIHMLFPFLHKMQEGRFLDNESPAHRDKVMAYYKSTVQRFMYATGKEKVFLSKNVISTGRLKTMLETFPNAKVIYLIRNPYKAVPSFISMFITPWKKHSPEIAKDSIAAREWGELAMDYYNYFHECKKDIPEDQWATVRYEDLVEDPQGTVRNVYQKLNIPITEKMDAALSQQTKRSKNYKSKHSYTLEEFGLSKDHIYNRVSAVMDEYGFEK